MSRVIRVLLTGGPMAGKTTVLEALRATFADGLIVAPEIPTVLLKGGFPPPGEVPDPVVLEHFQRAVFNSVVALEESLAHVAGRTARERGRPVVLLCDRGRLDGEAYVPGGSAEFERVVRHGGREPHLHSYDHVLLLRSMAHHAPDQWGDGEGHRTGNDVRMESNAEIAALLDQRTWNVYTDHPSVTRLTCERGIEGKIAGAKTAIEQLLAGAVAAA